MCDPGPAEVWAGGPAYEPYVGRWSRMVAREFVQWLDPAAGASWLDLGCGTGALADAVSRFAAPATVTAIDRSAGYVRYARTHLPDRRVHFAIADGARLPIDSGAIAMAVSGLVLNFLPDPAAGAAAMARVTRIGGRVAAYVWDY